MRFRKKPVVINAIQYTGNNLKEIIDFTGKYEKFDDWFASWEDYVSYVKSHNNIFKIFTLEGTMESSPGDWIIQGVNGENYPCKPDIFEKTYEKVVD